MDYSSDEVDASRRNVSDSLNTTSNVNTTLEVDTSIEDDNENVIISQRIMYGCNNDSVLLSTPPRNGDSSNSGTPQNRTFFDDIADEIQSDDDLMHQPFLNEDDDEDDSYNDVSRTDYLDLKSDTHYLEHQYHIENEDRYNVSSTFSANLSSTTGSTAGGATIGRSNVHRSSLSPEFLNRYDDTTTSYNTDDGYADDESERKIRSVQGENPSMREQQQPNNNTSSTAQNSQQAAQQSSSPSNRLTSTPSRLTFAGNLNSQQQLPSSGSFFRYLRSWGKSQSDSTTLVTEATDLNVHVSSTIGGTGGDRGELTSDDDDDDFSMSQEETSWVDDGMSDSSDEDETDDDRLDKYNIDWNCLPMLPNRFCLPPPAQYATDDPMKDKSRTAPPHYLDVALYHNAQKDLTVHEATEFVLNHGSLLQAVLQLLAERDQVGVEGSLDSTVNIWKKGSLKKLSFAVGRRKNHRPAVAGTWKVKYVELRQGNLCYYEDSGKTGRKTIHLRQADTIVQESSYRGPGFVFELLVQGSPTRHWMASSEEERQAWIKAIQAATIGDDAPRKDLDLQPYEESLEVYTSLRESLQQAETQQMYLEYIHAAMKELASLQVPVQWVQEQIENDLSPILLGTLKPPKFGRSPQKLLKSSIAEFWKNMNQTTFSINGLTVRRNTQLASERIVGALTRCILEYDKAYYADEREFDTNESSYISELQAISYARQILSTVLRSKERQDTAFVVRYLLENPGVVISEQSLNDDNDTNPVNIEVTFAGEDLPDEFLHSEEISAWVWTRTRRKNPSSIAASVSTGNRKPRQTFAVLSGTVLSYYGAASPRPHGLRGQLVLSATTTVRYEGEEIVPESDSNHNNGVRHVLCISFDNHQDRVLSFDQYNDAMTWKDAIQLAIDTASTGVQNPPRVVTTTSNTATHNSSLMAPGKMLKGAERAIKVAADGTIQGSIRVIKGAKDGGIRVIRGAKDGGIRVIRTATGSGFKVIRGAVGMLQRQTKSSDDLGPSMIDRNNISGSGGSNRRPSFQMLFNNTIVAAQDGKREPTVQCVFQTTQTFIIRDRNNSEHDDDYLDHSNDSTTNTPTGDSSNFKNRIGGAIHNPSQYYDNNYGSWIQVQAKLYQAFLMSGGTNSGRIARGDALVELLFVETKVDEQFFDDDASC